MLCDARSTVALLACLVVQEVAPQAVRGVRVQGRGRLVEEEELGPVDQGLGEQHPGLLAGREPPARPVEEAFEVEARREFRDPLRGPAQAVEAGVDPQVLRHRQPRRQVDVGAREVDPAEYLVASLRHRLAEDPDPPGAGGEQAQQHRDRRRLAGPVGAQKGHRPAAGDREVQAVHRDDRAVGLAQPRHLDRGWGRVSGGAGRCRRAGTLDAGHGSSPRSR
jgi:hypothetical protein